MKSEIQTNRITLYRGVVSPPRQSVWFIWIVPSNFVLASCFSEFGRSVFRVPCSWIGMAYISNCIHHVRKLNCKLESSFTSLLLCIGEFSWNLFTVSVVIVDIFVSRPLPGRPRQKCLIQWHCRSIITIKLPRPKCCIKYELYRLNETKQTDKSPFVLWQWNEKTNT